MNKKTHLAIGLAIGLYFVRFATYKLSFIPIVLLSSLLPDIDSASSFLGERRIFRPVQVFFKHRGPIHSFTVAVLISLIFLFFYPIVALPFFLGYSFHLFVDSFTPKGIRPFWPLKNVSSGIAKSGGILDKGIFSVFIVLDIALFIFLFV